MKVTPVNVDIDREGNTAVTPIEIKDEAASADESQDQSQDDENDSDQNTGDEAADGSDDDASADSSSNDDGSADEGEEDSGEESEDLNEDESGSEEEDEEEGEDEGVSEDDIVDYEKLPEAVQKYLEFFEDTNGSIEDFIKVNEDPSKLPIDDVIAKFYKKQNPTLDAEDIAFEMQERFGFDSDLEDEKDIRRKKIAKKKLYGEALASLKADNEKYATSLVSSGKGVSKEALEAIEFKQNFDKQQAESRTGVSQKRDNFVKETNKVLGKDFKGFEVDLGDGNKATYKPENISKTKEQNLDVNNLLDRFTDKEGNISDVKGYHRALTIASDPEAFAKHFYEMGKADNAEQDAKTSKNINMNPRQSQPNRNNGKSKFKAVSVGQAQGGSGLKPQIKLRNY